MMYVVYVSWSSAIQEADAMAAAWLVVYWLKREGLVMINQYTESRVLEVRLSKTKKVCMYWFVCVCVCVCM